MTTRQALKCSLLSTERLEDVDGRLAVTDADSHGIRHVKFWVGDALSGPAENRSPVGAEAPSRVSLHHHTGIPPFPSLGARVNSRTPASPQRRDRPSVDQSGQDRSYGHGSPDFGGGVGLQVDDTSDGGPIPENVRSPTRIPHTHHRFHRKIMFPKNVLCSLRSH